MKRIVALILALALCMAMAVLPANAEGEKVIEFYCIKEEVKDVMQKIIDLFQAEHPDVKINLTYNSDGTTVLQTRIATNDVPDIMMVYPAERAFQRFYDDGYVIDLAGQDFMKNVEESMLALSDYNGVQMALPYTLSTYGIYYNKDIFAKVGVEVPKTLDELIAVSAKLKEAGYDAFCLPLQNGQNQIAERLCGAFNPDTYQDFAKVFSGEMDVADVGSLKAIADLFIALKPLSTADAMGLNGDNATSDFVNSVAAMRFNGSWFLSSILNANPDANVGMFGIPSPVTGKTIVPVNIDTSFSVSASTKYPEECLAFMEFLTRPEIATMYYEVDGNINMIKGVTYDKTQLMDVYNTVMSGDMSITQINRWGTNGSSLRSDLGAALQNLYMEEDVKAFQEECKEAIMNNWE